MAILVKLLAPLHELKSAVFGGESKGIDADFAVILSVQERCTA